MADPFAKLKRDIQVVTKLLQGGEPDRPDFSILRPPLKRSDGNALWNLMRRCWALSPDDRPTMTDVYNELLALSPESSDHYLC